MRFSSSAFVFALASIAAASPLAIRNYGDSGYGSEVGHGQYPGFPGGGPGNGSGPGNGGPGNGSGPGNGGPGNGGPGNGGNPGNGNGGNPGNGNGGNPGNGNGGNPGNGNGGNPGNGNGGNPGNGNGGNPGNGNGGSPGNGNGGNGDGPGNGNGGDGDGDGDGNGGNGNGGNGNGGNGNGGNGNTNSCGVTPGQISALTPLLDQLGLSEGINGVKELVDNLLFSVGDLLESPGIGGDGGLVDVVNQLVQGLLGQPLDLHNTVDALTSILENQVPCLLDTVLPQP
ncbi:hypothetical protein H4R24_005458 [Coemansia sp. RSA 988]|nr:hypothetical protein H4R24_005458 [Coemansia sp. RSA 988]